MNLEESTLDKIRTRPRFKMQTKLNANEYVENLNKYIISNKDKYEGSINTEISTINVKTVDYPFWKPYLSLRIEKEENNTTIIRGVFGPSSAVWTFFMFLYFMFTILWMTFFTMWYVEKQIKSNDYPWALTASFIVLGLLAVTFLGSKIGQLRSIQELNLLRKFAIESTLPHEDLTDTNL